MPRVSVVMPAYNCGRYIRQAIDSVLGQTEPDLELIVVDDGSTDDTPALVQAAAAADPRIRVVRQRNSGKPAIPRNRGIRETRGEVVCFLDADDVWRPEKVRTGLSILDEQSDVDLLFHDVEYMGEDGALSGRYCCLGSTDFAQRVLTRSRSLGNRTFLCDGNALFFFICTKVTAIYMSAAMIRRPRLFREPLFFAEDLIAGEDVDLWFRVAKSSGIAFVDAPLSGYRIHGGSVTHRPGRNVVDPVLAHMRNYERCDGFLDRRQRRAYRRRIAEDLLSAGYQHACAGQHAEAWCLYWRSLRWRLGGNAMKGLLRTTALRFAQRGG